MTTDDLIAPPIIGQAIRWPGGLHRMADSLPRCSAAKQMLNSELGRVARLVIDPDLIASSDMAPRAMPCPFAASLLTALRSLRKRHQVITAYSLRDELRRSGADAREVLRRLRLILSLAQKMESLGHVR